MTAGVSKPAAAWLNGATPRTPGGPADDAAGSTLAAASPVRREQSRTGRHPRRPVRLTNRHQQHLARLVLLILGIVATGGLLIQTWSVAR